MRQALGKLDENIVIALKEPSVLISSKDMIKMGCKYGNERVYEVPWQLR